ncbi:DcaP family trimeric outer membrane transporter [Paracoccus sp. DMF-8]|uniref:DcaP family trimeric outer membrane transporter n=1 Tax=Paracoccus sp. DMF-8 TaxID=3019445 RepID=UPI0023E355BC|nr:DcaP family trimeric outer membrane transporter [Paracoccus sp. DMF-8]MDF3608057.1 DcaP family trimeric outer membrane transporter [Paracoccus sp. DMF-8]
MKRKQQIGTAGKLAAVALIGGAGMAGAQDLSSLEARIAALENSQPAQGQVSVAPGVKLSFYGYTKLDMISDNNFDLGATTGAMAGVTTGSALEGSGSNAHAYESRLGMRGTIDTDIGEVKFNIEGDFFGSGGGNFRLRHAYGEVGPLLAGQTWTNWVPAEGTVATVQDFNGPAGSSYYRTPQIRYTHRPNDQWRLSLAIEEDYAPGTQTRLAVTGFAGYSNGPLKVGIGAISRGIETTDHGDVTGYGYAIGADYEAWQGGKIHAQYLGGKGITTLLNNAGFSGLEVENPGAKYAFDVDTNGDTIKATTMRFGVTQKIGEKSDISLAHGFQRYDDYAGALGNYTKEVSSSYVTYRYHATKQVMLAAEVSHVEREQFDGTKFDNTRLQGVVKFTF